MEHEIYSDDLVLYKIKDLFNYRFKLEENRNDIMVFCDKKFWFSARKKSTMDRIDNIGIEEILKSCNNIESSDELFYDENDLLEELNDLVNNKNIVDYMKTYMENVYGATCVLE